MWPAHIAIKLFILLHLSFFSSGEMNQKFVGCYFTNWSHYRSGVAKFLPGNINVTLCSHIHFYSVTTDPATNSLQRVEPGDEAKYNSVTSLKANRPQLKVLLTLRVDDASPAFVSGGEAQLEGFCNNTVAFLRHHNFDGLDVEWKVAESCEIYLRLFQALRNSINKEVLTGNQERLLLSSIVTGDRCELAQQLAPLMDYVIIEARDLFGPWSTTLGHHCPLFLPRSNNSSTPHSFNSAHDLVQGWLDNGWPDDMVHKLVLMVASYGRTQKPQRLGDTTPRLGDPADNRVSVRINGPLTRIEGAYTYFELCNLGQKEGWTKVLIEESRAHYMFKDSTAWLSYEDTFSLTEKARYVVSRGMGGLSLWTLADDDFTGGVCGQGEYPLLTSINSALSQFTCPYGFWGTNCSKTCGQCSRRVPCDLEGGHCPDGCLEGWVGDFCDEKDCQDRLNNCEELCSVLCDITNCSEEKRRLECRSTDGRKYTTECTNGTFGPDCQPCPAQCEGEQPCDKVSGECPEGCKSGWTNPYCDKPVPGEDEFPLVPVIGGVGAALFLLVFFAVVVKCVRRKANTENHHAQTYPTEPETQSPSAVEHPPSDENSTSGEYIEILAPRLSDYYSQIVDSRLSESSQYDDIGSAIMSSTYDSPSAYVNDGVEKTYTQIQHEP